MPVNLSIKNAPDDVVQRLKERASKNRRSLQGELLVILEEAARVTRKLTIEEATERLKRIDFTTPDEGTAIIRADRDSR